MRSRLIRDSIILSIVPLITVALTSFFGNYETLRIAILLSGVLIQIITIIVTKRCLKKLLNPSTDILLEMGVERIPAAYEPGKYDSDSKIAGLLVWAGVAAPFLFYYAQLNPKTIINPVLNFATYTSPNFSVIFVALGCLAIGSLSLLMWAKIIQANVIASEGSDGNRYLLQGFAEIIDDTNMLYDYIDLAKMKR